MSTLLLSKAREFARRELARDSTGHDWWHTQRVARMAVRLAQEEKADAQICELAAWLHDVADEKLNPSKEAGLQKVETWLNRQHADSDCIRHVMNIVTNMSFNGGQNPPMETPEGKVVQDADRLDAIGAIGVARAFMYGGARGHQMHDPGIPPRKHFTAAGYRRGKNTVINHFPEKLLKLKDLLNTAAARKIAGKRHDFLLRFLDQFNREWEDH